MEKTKQAITFLFLGFIIENILKLVLACQNLIFF